ncbi:hypothetical protein Trydic_g8037 [Trypoxylus dichotomus]
MRQRSDHGSVAVYARAPSALTAYHSTRPSIVVFLDVAPKDPRGGAPQRWPSPVFPVTRRPANDLDGMNSRPSSARSQQSNTLSETAKDR